MSLYESDALNGESFNFGPLSKYSKTVKELLDNLSSYWDLDHVPSKHDKNPVPFHEAGLLKLNCDKALFHLKWLPVLDYNKLIEFTSIWYYNFYKTDVNMSRFTLNQITEYEELAINKDIPWTKSK